MLHSHSRRYKRSRRFGFCVHFCMQNGSWWIRTERSSTTGNHRGTVEQRSHQQIVINKRIFEKWLYSRTQNFVTRINIWCEHWQTAHNAEFPWWTLLVRPISNVAPFKYKGQCSPANIRCFQFISGFRCENLPFWSPTADVKWPCNTTGV